MNEYTRLTKNKNDGRKKKSKYRKINANYNNNKT